MAFEWPESVSICYGQGEGRDGHHKGMLLLGLFHFSYRPPPFIPLFRIYFMHSLQLGDNIICCTVFIINDGNNYPSNDFYAGKCSSLSVPYSGEVFPQANNIYSHYISCCGQSSLGCPTHHQENYFLVIYWFSHNTNETVMKKKLY